MKHTDALTPSVAIEVMNDTCLITPETFDSFLIALLGWYQEESYEGEIPNLFQIFNFHEHYTEIFFEIFSESLAWRNTYTYSQEQPRSTPFDESEKDYYSQLLRSNFNRLQSSMIYDFERTMRSLNFVYRWDTTEVGGDDLFVKNQVICEVW